MFTKKKSGITTERQTVWIRIRPDLLLGLIGIQTVRKFGYKQMTLVDKELSQMGEMW